MRKQIISALCVAVAVIPMLTIPSHTSAKTLRDLTNEVNKAQSKAQENKNNIQLTESQMATVKNEIEAIYKDIDRIQKEIEQKNKEIQQLQVKIEQKKEESKNLFRFLQISSGESVYLEYIFGAKDFTDFIYRVSEVEQLTKYNDQVMKEMKELIEENDKKSKELAVKEKELGSKQEELNVNLAKLGEQRESLGETQKSLDEDVANAKEVLQMYKNLGCKMDEDISTCGTTSSNGGGAVITSNGFYRPLVQGCITSGYGNRNFNGGKFHYGIDASSSSNIYNTKVYPMAAGRVAKILYASSGNMGGNEILIHHTVNGQNYTTDYAHLASINVSQGQVVTKDTVLGIMGSTGFSTGPHLHFALSKGRYYLDYYSYNTFIANSLNPGNYVSLPNCWNGR